MRPAGIDITLYLQDLACWPSKLHSTYTTYLLRLVLSPQSLPAPRHYAISGVVDTDFVFFFFSLINEHVWWIKAWRTLHSKTTFPVVLLCAFGKEHRTPNTSSQSTHTAHMKLSQPLTEDWELLLEGRGVKSGERRRELRTNWTERESLRRLVEG